MIHVGWAQRFIVPTNSDSTLREMVGTIKRCAHPHCAVIYIVVYKN